MANVTGGISADEVSEAALAMGAPPTEAGASLNSRFARKLSDLVDARIAKGEQKLLSIFLRSESLHQDSGCCENTEFPLLTNAHDPVSGYAWLSTASLSTAYKLKLSWEDQSTLFEAVRDVGLGHLPALVIDWRATQPIGTLYPNGVKDTEYSVPVAFEQLAISSTHMKETLDRFYERTLRTPALITEGGGTRIWQDAQKGIPELGPERIIQGRLSDILKTYLTRHEVRPETTTQEGRADIVIYRKAITANHLPAVVNEWVLELKALCDMTSTGSPVPASKIPEAIVSGLEQAAGYKAKLNAVNAAVCCFDMLKTDGQEACFTPVKDAAAAAEIELWRWYLFRSTHEARSAKGYVALS